nr:hypothetical protein [Tanacetum cinerariifolium]
MRDSPAYKTYLAFATGAVTPKKERKFKKPASLLKKKAIVGVEEPAEKHVKKPAARRQSAGGSSEGADLESEVPDEPKGKSTNTSEGTGLKPGALDVSKANSSKSEYDTDLNKTDEEEEDKFVHTPDDYVPTDDENVDDEEYECINKEMYDDVDVELKDAEPAIEEKDLEKEVKELKIVNHSSELRAIIKSKVLVAIKEYLGTSLDDARYKVLQRHTADLSKEHFILANVVEKLKLFGIKCSKAFPLLAMKIPLLVHFATKFTIQQYLQNEHYAIWEVIEFGDSYKAPPEESGKGPASESSAKKKGRTIVIITKDMRKKRNDAKARTTLLLALPDEHQLRFSKSRKGKVYTASVPTASTQVSTASTDVAAASLSHDTVCAYIASQSNSSQIKYEDTTQIDEDDIKEIDIKWNALITTTWAILLESAEHLKQGPKEEELAPKALMAIDGIGWDWSYMANEEENHALVADDEVPTEFTLMAKSSSSLENEVYDDSYCSKSCRKNTENLNTKISKLNEQLSDCKTDLYHYKSGLSHVEARLVEFKEQEIKLCEKIRGLERDVKVRNNKIEYLMNELEQVKKEKEGLDNKLTSLESASKDLDNLLRSQRSDKDKEGLGYNAVLPLPAQVYSPPKKDLSWTGLPKFVNDTVTDYSRHTPSIDTSKSDTSDLQSNNFFVFELRESSGSIMSKHMIKFVKAADCSRVTKTNNTENARKSTVKYAEMCRNTTKSPKVRAVLLKTSRTPVAISRPNMNVAQPKLTSFAKTTHSNVKRPFQGKSAVRTQPRVLRVSTVTKYFPTVDSKFSTVKSTFTVDLGNKGKAVKASACWIWRPKQNTTEKGPNYNGVSVTFKKYQYIDTQGRLKFTWTFFLRTKDETSSILKNFITEIKNLKDLKVKIIRNKTLIDAARTMLADAKLPVTFWAEAVNTTCCIQNRVLVNKSQNKTPYELFNSITPAIRFLRPFGCHVMVLNTLDHLRKFDANGDEGYFVRYSMSSKAFRVFNKRTKKVEKNLHVDFLENKLIEKGAGPNWLFDINTLTNSRNYVPVVIAGTSSTNISGTKHVASQVVKKNVSSLRYIALLNWFHEAHIESSNSDAQDDSNTDVPESSGISNPTATSKVPLADQMESLIVESEIPTVSLSVLTVCLDISPESSSGLRLISKGVFSHEETPSLGNALTLSNRFEDTFGDTTNALDSNEVEADLSNMKSSIPASPTPTFRIHKDHPKSQIIGPVDTPEEPKKIFDALKDPSWVESMQEEHLQFKIQNPSRFQDPEFPYRVYKVEKVMYGLHQAPRSWYVYVDDIIFGSSNPRLCKEFEAPMHDKFQMGKHTFFLGLQVLQKKDGIFLSQDKYVGDILKKFGYSDVRSANTSMDKENPWGKDGPGKDVELHLYRSMIGSLMYLTASRPDIMFAICACIRYQVTPKECHLHAVKRIFRYLKGHPKLGLWYPKESPFDLVAYSDSDYGGATQDRKSTTGEKTEHNNDFHQIVDFLEASHIRYALTISPTVYVSHIRQFWSTVRIETTNLETKILAIVDGLATPTEPHHIPSPQEQHSPHHDPSSPSHPTTTTEPIPQTLTVTPTETPTLRRYTRRAIRIAQSKALSPAADEPISLLRDDKQGEAFLTEQFFVDMLKQFHREDLHQLWTLVKETLSIKQAIKDKEKELWVELKRLFEPDFEDHIWTHNHALMHDPLKWKLYDTCGVHHVFSKDQEIFMLVEKDYPLRKGLATVMISNRLQCKRAPTAELQLLKKFALLDEDKIYPQSKTHVSYLWNVSCDYSFNLRELVSIILLDHQRSNSWKQHKHQGKPQKSAEDICKVKMEQTRKQQETIYTITSSESAKLQEFDQKRTLFETMTKTKSFNKNTKNKTLYRAIIEFILEDENAINKGVADKSKKRKPDYVDRDEGPPAGPDQGMKRKKTGKDTKPSKNIKDTQVPQNFGEDTGNTNEPLVVNVDLKNWFKKPKRPLSLDPEWNECKIVDNKPTQKWLCDLAKAETSSKTFDDLMSTLIDFNAFVMNCLQISYLTQDILVGPAYKLLKGTCRSYIELEYNMEECPGRVKQTITSGSIKKSSDSPDRLLLQQRLGILAMRKHRHNLHDFFDQDKGC